MLALIIWGRSDKNSENGGFPIEAIPHNLTTATGVSLSTDLLTTALTK